MVAACPGVFFRLPSSTRTGSTTSVSRFLSTEAALLAFAEEAAAADALAGVLFGLAALFGPLGVLLSISATRCFTWLLPSAACVPGSSLLPFVAASGSRLLLLPFVLMECSAGPDAALG